MAAMLRIITATPTTRTSDDTDAATATAAVIDDDIRTPIRILSDWAVDADG